MYLIIVDLQALQVIIGLVKMTNFEQSVKNAQFSCY